MVRKNYRAARAHNRETQGDVNAIGYRLMYRDQILNLPASDSNEPGSSSKSNPFSSVVTKKVSAPYEAFFTH